MLALTFLACDSDPASAPLPPRDQCVLAVVASDYVSTAVSLLTNEGDRCAPDIITSGSRPPGLLTALSGDIDLPSEPAPDGTLQLIDRYPNAVVTTLDTLTGDVREQVSVAPGFAGNPQDIASTPRGRLVARLQFDAAAERGSDLLLLPDTRIDLAPYTDAGFDPTPTRFARANGLLWIGLAHLTRDLVSDAGAGRALALDPATLDVVHQLDTSPLENCGHPASAGPDGDLWLVCQGLFADGDDQLAHSGLAHLAATTADFVQHATIIRATDLGGPSPAPLSFDMAVLDTRVLVITLGDADRPDRLLLVGPERTTVIAESEAFTLGAPLALPDRQMFLVADASPRAPKIRRFTWPDAAGHATELSPVEASPSGLPPRHIARLR